ncbi:ROK-family transcriptional regulator [Corynebacterium xerosis]|uniref:ROK family transcriptional regulator n=1 Tax=Brachybacterium tyrofermentans TaxID=47848 RepID=UPI000A1AAFE1|nr:ROK-family transcriptional regulator [Corynebacterium xerosis]
MTTSPSGAGTSGADTTLVRRWNRSTVLAALRTGPERTLTEMAQATGLSRQTLTAVFTELDARGLVQMHAPATGTSGRPARRYSFQSTAGYVLGLYFSPTQVLALVTDLDGTIIAREHAATPRDLPAPDRLRRAREISLRATAPAGDVWAVGVATTGVVDPQGTVRRASQIPGWTGLDLAGTTGSWFHSAAVAGNDGTLAALGEKWQGAARYANDVALILSGRPTGQGILLGGRAHHGRSGAAAELGRLLHDQTWNAAAVLEEAGRSAEEVFRAAAEGEQEASELADHLAHHTARGASVLVSVLDPELVVIAGEFTAGGQPFVDATRQHLSTMCINVPEVALSVLGDDVVPLGAARLALDHLEEREYVLDA